MSKRFTRFTIATTVTLATAAVLLAQATQPTQPTQATKPAAPSEGDTFTTPGGVQVVRTRAGEGAKNGDIVFIHYTGKLTDGMKFDSSFDRGEPIDFVLGSGRVIAGWEEGLQGMHVGERRTLTIPPQMAYKEEGRPPKIPGNATLVFDVELMGLQRK